MSNKPGLFSELVSHFMWTLLTAFLIWLSVVSLIIRKMY